MKLRQSALFRSSQFLAVAFSATVFCHFAASSASAQALYWDNDGATPGFGAAAGTWADPTTGDATQGWSTDPIGALLPTNVTTTTGNTLNFGTSTATLAAGTVTVSGTVNANRVVFAAAPSGVFTLSGGTIALGGTSPSITTNRGGQIIASALTLNANTSISTATSGTAITLNGKIDGPSNLTFTTTNVNLGGSNTFFFLGSANTYTGTTTITVGNNGNALTVRPTVNNALPTTTVLALTGGVGAGSGRQVAYDLNNFDQTIAGLTNTPAASRTQRIINGAGTSKLTINNTFPASSSFSGNINGSGTTTLSLAKTGTGTQILSGTNSFTGSTTITGGKLIGVVGGNCASSNVIINNTLGTFGISVTDNTKTWTCTGLNPTAAGEIEFSFGAVIPSTTVSPLTITVLPGLTGSANFDATPKIRVTTDAALNVGTYPLMTWDTVSGNIPSTADLIPPPLLPQTAATLEVSGNTLNLVIASTAATVVKANNPDNLNLGTSWVGGTAPDANKLAIWNNVVTTANTTVLGANATWAGISILNPNGLVTINGSNTLTLGNAAVDIDLSSANTADLVLNCPLALGADNIWDVATTRTVTLGGQISGAFPVTKQGDGTAILSSAANNYSSATTVAAGTLQLGASNVIPDGIGNGNVSVAGTLDLNGKSDTVNGLTGAGFIDNTLAATSPVLTLGANDQTSTFGGVIQNTAGTVNLVKTGTGTLVLGGANTLSGSVTVNGGTLGYSNTTPFDNASGIALTGGTTLRSEVNAATIAPPVTVGATATIARITAPISAGSGTTQISVTFSSPISGDGDVTFVGLNSTNSYGNVILNAPCDYDGDTVMTCSDELATPSTLGNNNIFVRLGAENALPTTTVLTLDGGGGAGSGRFCELNLFGNNQTLAGLTNVTGNLLRSQEVYNTAGGDAAILTVNNTAPFTYSGKLGGQIGASGSSGNNLGLTKSGAGTFTISGANTYTGATTISGGTLALGALGTLPDASAVSIGAGTLNAATAGTETAGTLNVTGAAAISLAAGAQLVFADSSAVNTGTWAGNLSLSGFVSGTTLNFSSSTGLTAQQLSKISAPGFTNFGLDAEGDLTADPVSGGTFADWLLANAPATGFVTDTDKDGLANGVENVLGSNPNAYNAGLTEVSSTATSVIFKHTLNPTIASDVTYGYEWSTNLTEWKTTGQTNTGGTTATITPSAPVLGVVTVTVTITGGPPAKLFGRLAAKN